MIGNQFLYGVSFGILSLLFMTFVKGSLMYFVVYCVTRIAKSISPELKHLLWSFSILGYMLIPIFSIVMPDLPVTTLIVHEGNSDVYKAAVFLLNHRETIGDAVDSTAAPSSIQFRPDNRTERTGARWYFLTLSLWFAGTVFSSYKIIKGKMSLFRLVADVCRKKDRRFKLILDQALENMGIHRTVECVSGPRCRVPFTCRFLKPIIVLPLDSARWSNSKIRAVLVHELAHIKRNDNLTQLIARLICTLFWFVPFIWIAYANLCLEQEESCDAFVIHGGTRPTEYAKLMLRFARHASECALSAGIFISKGRVKMLEKRIKNVLYSGSMNRILKGGKKMMTRAFMVGAVLLMSVLVFPASYAKEREFYKPSGDEEIFGTWVNTEYSGDQGWPQKIVLLSWGYIETYMRIKNKHPVWPATSTLVDKWTDSEGNIWYRDFQRQQAQGAYYQLNKISNNGTVLEFVWKGGNFPTEAEMDPSGTTYRIYYRQ